MYDGKGIGRPAFRDMVKSSRLFLMFDTGQIAVPAAGNICLFRASPSCVRGIFPGERTFSSQSFKPAHDQLAEMGIQDFDQVAPPVSMAVMQLTRSRDENRALFAKAYSALAPGGTLVVDGAKTDGIESLLKAVRKLLPVDETVSKAHGKVFWLTKTDSPAVLSDWAKALEPRKNQDGYWSAAGMFSAEHIDKASALLAPLLAGKLSGQGADLGAGWGYLSDQALKTNEKIASLDLIEAEATALDCAKRNVTDPRAGFMWQDVTAMPTKNHYDFVVLNPPFHLSRKPDPALGQRFIEAAARILTPKGKLYLVANKQLAYESSLDACFHHSEQIEITPQFKCIFARKPKT